MKLLSSHRYSSIVLDYLINDILEGYEAFGGQKDGCVKWAITPYERGSLVVISIARISRITSSSPPGLYIDALIKTKKSTLTGQFPHAMLKNTNNWRWENAGLIV